MPRLAPRFPFFFSFLLVLPLLACSGSGAAPPPTQAPATATTAPPPAPSTAIPPPPTPTPALRGGIHFQPAELVQGGTAVVYLEEPATAATLRFQDRQYPMLRDGERWWAMIGVGAFQATGLLPVSINYVPPGQTQAASVVRSINIVRRDFPVEYIQLSPETAALLAPEIVQNELAQRASIYSGYTLQRLWSGPFIAPVPGPITGVFGEGRSYNGGPVTDYHRGTDWAAETGTPVRAAAAGRVAFVGDLRIRGGSVIIDHGAGVFTAYHHLSQKSVAAGQMVAQGQQIGAVGSTGLVTGPHLHWELVVRGVEVDGALWLEGKEMGP